MRLCAMRPGYEAVWYEAVCYEVMCYEAWV